MLSYRHAFHAGNHADVLKHAVLVSILDYLKQKDKPFWYVDTHSGAGIYDLAATYLYAGGGSAIDVFRVDLATGALTFLAETPAGDRAYVADMDRRSERLYVQTQLGLPVAIRSFARGTDGTLAAGTDYPLPHPFVEGMTQLLLDRL